MAKALGIAVGSTSVKACLLEDGARLWAEVVPHDGDVRSAVTGILTRRGVEPGTPSVVTGNEGRHQLRLRDVVKAIAFEHALDALALDVRAVVSVGGEDLGVYTVDSRRRIENSVTGSKCAAGTGEFFVQQLRRMDLDIDAVHHPEVAAARVRRLSSRCSVFMKSDCTHALNKGEATCEDIVLSLCHVMARKVVEFLGKAKVDHGRILLAGGAFRNPHLTRFVRESLPLADCVTLDDTPHLEALGAAHLASSEGTPLPPLDRLFRDGVVAFTHGRPLASAAGLVTVVPSARTVPVAGRRYVLGVDGGSTTTKAALVDVETLEVAASHYDRTLGDPVAALKRCLRAVREQVREAVGDEEAVRIVVVATTGSSRELLGVYCGTPGVYNEIIAHTAGATHYDPAIDTIFEIGGQDAKYVSLRNHVPVDYAMNEACSAGTGSFLEESAAGDLDIHRAEEIGPLALEAAAPLRFGEHCSAFINNDIRKAIQQGASRPDIVAGLVLSVVSNYLNRVVGNRRVGDRIVLQGGVAKNAAVPLAFAALLGKRIVVPPDPELMGCLGVARVALRKLGEGRLAERERTLTELIDREITRGKEYRCRACENDCPIQVMAVADEHYHFGGRCNKYANLRHAAAAGDGVDYVDVRRRMHFETFAPKAEDLVVRREVTVGIPDCFTVHALWPFYSTFFHHLGVRVQHVTEVSEAGVAKGESNYCYPAEIAHGLMETLVRSDADYWFLPHVVTLPSYDKDLHACVCPLTQGLPYYLRSAFGADDSRILRPILEFTRGFESGAEAMIEMAARLGAGRDEAMEAFRAAVASQEACYREGRRIGRQVLEEARTAGRPVIVLLGRPYNAFTSTANMGIPRKFATRGCTVLPFDFLPIDDEPIAANMYWYFGQQDLKAAAQVKAHPNLFACMVTNFSCAPDSFILHHLRWTFNTKPGLVLELDSHTADAGIDTRIEAFLDIIDGYRASSGVDEQPMMVERDWDVRPDGHLATVVNRRSGEALPLTDPRVTLVWPSMGRRGTELISVVCRSAGIDAVCQGTPTVDTLARARAVASGKECVPALLVLGAFLEHFAEHPAVPHRVYLLFMPITTGPCRTGQYAVFYQNLFQELGYRNIAVLSLNCDNSYRELGPSFSRRAWYAIVLADYLKDIEYTLRALAEDPAAAMETFEAVWREILEAAGQGSGRMMAGLKGWARRLGRIPLARPLQGARRALIVGEIFVRQDDYSVETLVSTLTRQRIVPKVASISEWIHYLDWQQKRRLARTLAGMPLARRLASRELRQYATLRIEMAWKDWTERRVRRALALSDLVPEAPHGMDAIMRHVEQFASAELDSEAVLSPCTGLVAAEEGYDGVAVVAPFACLPGRVIEALFAPWARARGFPVICLENDGNPYPANVLSRLEVFACQVARGARIDRRPAQAEWPGEPETPAPRVPAAAEPGQA